jgi:hypothetical protein
MSKQHRLTLFAREIYEVAEEYGIGFFIGEEKTSSKCPMHGDGCGKRIKG